MYKLKEYFSLPFYTLMHPIDGFYEMRYEHKGRSSIIYVNLILFWISYSFRKQYTGFLINEVHPLAHNAFMDLISVLVIFILWCTGSWSITSLTNGEGKLKDIAMSVAYALTPMILTFIPATLLSNLLIDAEKEFFSIIIGVSIAWFLILLFTGTQSIHDFGVTKTIITILLTLISILVILFLTLLFFSLIQQITVFVKSLATEILYRM